MLFVYFLEEHPTYSQEIQLLFERSLMLGDHLFTSSLAFGEAMVGIQRLPLERAKSLRQLLFALPFTLVDFDQTCIEPFATLRNRSVPAADAINLACASSANADVFITNDAGLRTRTIAGIGQVVSIADATLLS